MTTENPDEKHSAPLLGRPKKESLLPSKVRTGWRIGLCWARYALFGARRHVSGLVDFACGNYLFRAIQHAKELEVLGEILAARSPRCALEIGTHFGGTLFFLTRLASPSAVIISVDLPRGKFGGGYGRHRAWAYKCFARGRQRLELLWGDSHSIDTFERIKAALGGQSLDYLFLDGDHTYEGVKCDFEMYSPLVGKGGLIAFHDIAEGTPDLVGGVPRYWCEVKAQHRHMEIINDPKQGWAGIGLVYVD